MQKKQQAFASSNYKAYFPAINTLSFVATGTVIVLLFLKLLAPELLFLILAHPVYKM